MEKITMDSFKNNKVLTFITFLLAFLTGWYYFQEPTYFREGEAFVLTILAFVVLMPLFTIWFQMAWNRMLVKIFPLKQISYGVAFLLILILIVLVG